METKDYIDIFGDLVKSPNDIDSDKDSFIRKIYITCKNGIKLRIEYQLAEQDFKLILIEKDDNLTNLATDKKFRSYVRKNLIKKVGLIKSMKGNEENFDSILSIIKSYIFENYFYGKQNI